MEKGGRKIFIFNAFVSLRVLRGKKMSSRLLLFTVFKEITISV